jgi:hypothetical protein
MEADPFFLTNIKETKSLKEDVLVTTHNKTETISSRMDDSYTGRNIHALIR